MASTTISSLGFAGQQMSIYYGIPVLIAGIFGGLINTIVFLSLQTFRQSSCAFYLTIMSIVNIGQLFTGLLSRIMINGFAIDWTQNSLFYCKFRYFCFQTCTLISMTCLCLATIDQYFATCSRPRWQQWSNIKLAQRITIVSIFIWILHRIPFLFFYNQVVSYNPSKVSCAATNLMFLQYRAYFATLLLTGLLPIFISVLFGIAAYHNVKQLVHRTVPLVRRELDKQLTVMVLVQVLVNSIAVFPYAVMFGVQTNPNITNDSRILAIIQFTYTVTLLIFYSNFSVSINETTS